jgi:hypothetical protein
LPTKIGVFVAEIGILCLSLVVVRGLLWGERCGTGGTTRSIASNVRCLTKLSPSILELSCEKLNRVLKLEAS